MKWHHKAILLLAGIAFAFSHAWASAPDSVQVCRRLSTLQRQIPLPYHHTLRETIAYYDAKSLPAECALYDSLITQEILSNNLPEELRYLPLALTGMNPNHHRDSRAGVWHLPVVPALCYGLIVNEDHDERYSVEASTKAALHYLSDLYAVFGNWWECLLAYTNSPSAINQVKARHPGLKIEPWDYRDQHWLPDTDIIGNFIACNYVNNGTKRAVATLEETVQCPFDRPLSIDAISKYTDLPRKIILMLNPLFTSDPIQPLAPYSLCLPKTAEARFEANRVLIYEETNRQEVQAEEQALVAEKKNEEKAKAAVKAKTSNYITYTVKSGDTLNKIARKYHVKVSDLKKWNKLKGDMIREKQKLKIYQ